MAITKALNQDSKQYYHLGLGDDEVNDDEDYEFEHDGDEAAAVGEISLARSNIPTERNLAEELAMASAKEEEEKGQNKTIYVNRLHEVVTSAPASSDNLPSDKNCQTESGGGRGGGGGERSRRLLVHRVAKAAAQGQDTLLPSCGSACCVIS